MKQEWIINILLLCCASLCGLLIVEGLLRFSESEGFVLPIELGDQGLVVHTPNLDRYQYDNEAGERVHVVTNNRGFVGEDLGEKKADVLRIALLGDSFTEAMQVDYEAGVTVQLREAVAAYLKTTTTPYVGVELVNAAVGGTGTVDAALYYDRLVAPLDPDIVLLVAYTGNDIDDTMQYLDQEDLIRERSRWNDIRQVAAQQVQGSQRIKDRLYRSSATIRLLDKLVRGNEQLTRIARRLGVFRAPVAVSEHDVPARYLKYLDERSEQFDRAADLAVATIVAVHQSVRENGGWFGVVILNNGEVVSEMLAQDAQAQYPTLQEVGFVPDRVERDIVGALASTTPVLGTFDQFRAAIAEGEELYLVGGVGHLTEAGQDLLTVQIRDFLIHSFFH